MWESWKVVGARECFDEEKKAKRVLNMNRISTNTWKHCFCYSMHLTTLTLNEKFQAHLHRKTSKTSGLFEKKFFFAENLGNELEWPVKRCFYVRVWYRSVIVSGKLFFSRWKRVVLCKCWVMFSFRTPVTVISINSWIEIVILTHGWTKGAQKKGFGITLFRGSRVIFQRF